MSYQIITDAESGTLAAKVNAVIDATTFPIGSPVIDARGIWHQAVGPAGGGGGGLPAGSVAVANGDTILVTSSGTNLVAGTAVVDTSGPSVACEIGAGQHIVADGSLGDIKSNGGVVVASGTLGFGANPFIQLDTVHAVVANNGTLPVTNNGGTDSHNATATVSAGAITKVALAATTAMVDDADTTQIWNSALSASATGTFAVGGGSITNVTLPATTAIVNDGFALTGVAPTGAYTNTVTFTVTNGVITGIVLS